MDIQSVKQRFGIIGNYTGLNRAIETALLVAPTDLSILITGESGTGKEVFSQIIHTNSGRKHNLHIPVNCGAIPEGTINSELFGHEKGAFTGAIDNRKGYFEVADNGTIFLDEIGDLPLQTQVRLLRILETGEFIKVGSSKVQKTNVRVVAATNVNLIEAIKNNKFREDLYYRLNTVPIFIPPLRDRKEDIPLLFRKFSVDISEKYRMPVLKIDESAVNLLINYEWPGNIRQLKNLTEQMSIVESEKTISAEILMKYLPENFGTRLPALMKSRNITEEDFSSEREILYKILFDMKKDMSDLKKLVYNLMSQQPDEIKISNDSIKIFDKLYNETEKTPDEYNSTEPKVEFPNNYKSKDIQDTQEIVEESLSLVKKEMEFIKKALEKHKGKRKNAAEELGISERTLYRKIKEYDLE